MSPEAEDRYLKLARTAALQAGKLQMDSFGKSIKVMTKNTGIDLVTTVDRESDALIAGLLRQACPQDDILTEEQFQEGQAIAPLNSTWVVDPLDGTTNYAHGFPHFAVSIAYFHRGRPHLGVIYDPFKKEMFYTIRNRGAFLNDVPIYVSRNRVHTLSHALLATGFPYDIASCRMNNLDNFQRIAPLCQGVRRPGAAAPGRFLGDETVRLGCRRRDSAGGRGGRHRNRLGWRGCALHGAPDSPDCLQRRRPAR
jgi:myo-inositol-1(or 4)-monophosphatase